MDAGSDHVSSDGEERWGYSSAEEESIDSESNGVVIDGNGEFGSRPPSPSASLPLIAMHSDPFFGDTRIDMDIESRAPSPPRCPAWPQQPQIPSALNATPAPPPSASNIGALAMAAPTPPPPLRPSQTRLPLLIPQPSHPLLLLSPREAMAEAAAPGARANTLVAARQTTSPAAPAAHL